MFREGIQECEARMLVERAMAGKEGGRGLPADLAARCKKTIEEREKAFRFTAVGAVATWEGLRWYAASGWEERAYELFSCAGEAARALEAR
jgi:hypothetical protein